MITTDRVLLHLGIETPTALEFQLIGVLIEQLTAVLGVLTNRDSPADLEAGEDLKGLEVALLMLVERDFRALTEGRLCVKSAKLKDASVTYADDDIPPQVEQAIRRYSRVSLCA